VPSRSKWGLCWTNQHLKSTSRSSVSFSPPVLHALPVPLSASVHQCCMLFPFLCQRQSTSAACSSAFSVSVSPPVLHALPLSLLASVHQCCMLFRFLCQRQSTSVACSSIRLPPTRYNFNNSECH